MAVLTHQDSWTMSLSTEELRLVLKALRGALREDEVQDARKLCDALTKQRASSAKQTLQWTERLLKDVDPDV